MIAKAAPIPAIVYYFYSWQIAAIVALVLLAVILVYSGRTNKHFTLDQNSLTVFPSLFLWNPALEIPYENIQSLEVKYSVERDSRQWLLVHYKNKEGTLLSPKFRCDWIHRQDPPEIEDDHDHGHPEHELFELLEDEDFYAGSLEQLANELRDRGLLVKDVL